MRLHIHKTAWLVLSALLTFSEIGIDSAFGETISLTKLGQYQTGLFDQGSAEIVAYDPITKRLFAINAAAATVDVLDIHNPSAPVKIGTIDASSIGGGVNSVDVKKGIVAVAVEAFDPQQNGFVAFYNAWTLQFIRKVQVGAMPDMVTFTLSGNKVLVANEGEPNDAYTVDPEGSISIIDLSKGVRKAIVGTADFHQWNDKKDQLLAAGVRIFGPNATVARDFEPEYITVSLDERRAWVTLQESNALAVVDVNHAKVVDILPLGYKDDSLPGNELDASDRDSTINIRNWPVWGMYQPDAIDSYYFFFKNYLVTANEGDTRDYGGFSELVRIGSLNLDPTAFPDAADLKKNANLGRLRVTNTQGDTDGDGDFDRLYTFGGRSFSIWDTSGKLIYDSGAEFEWITASLLPEQFNSDNTENGSFDARSDDKGPEPEGLAIGHIGFRTYVFMALERIGGIMVYDITNPYHVSFVTYVNNRDFSVEETCFDTDGDEECDTTNPAVGDLGPEGLVFIPPFLSPNHKPLLVVGNEVSGTTTIFQIDAE